jgi:hypothetical protein
LSKKKRASDNQSEPDTSSPFLILIDPVSVQRAMEHIYKNLKDPLYSEQLTKLTQVSISHSLNTLQKLNQFSQQASKMDNEGMSKVVENSIDDLMRTYLQFSSDLLVLLQKLSSRTIEILDKASRQSDTKADS